MKTVGLATSAALAAAVGYLLLWPVPVDPVTWQAPQDEGYVESYAVNNLLQAVTGIDLGHFEGPEDATVGNDGHLYATTHDGTIIRIQDDAIYAVANVGGRPLGIQADRDGTLRPAAVPYSHVVTVNRDGEVLTNMHDPQSQFPALTGVVETPDALYLTSLFGHHLAKIAKQDL